MEVSRNQRRKMNTEKTTTPIPSMVVGLDRKVRLPRKPTKADIGRMMRLARDWQRKEDNYRSRLGDPIKGTMRSVRIKDREALLKLLNYVTAV